MSKPTPPSLPEEPTRKSLPLLSIVLLLAAFFLIVLVASILLLPDRGRNLLKLTSIHPIIQTLTAAL